LARTAAPLLLLDRDGVINRDSDQYIKSVDEWQPLPGSLEAIARLTRAGFTLAVVTNQSGVGRGLFDERTLAAIHRAMLDAVARAGGAIAGVYYCPHRPDAGCDCRKPRPALLLRAIAEHAGAGGTVGYVGDKVTDAEAAVAAGVRPILVGPDRRRPGIEGVEIFEDLAAAAEALIAERSQHR
jgi:D-glycero-D-manno-heptose 1,7-bisphosphate phosphatase